MQSREKKPKSDIIAHSKKTIRLNFEELHRGFPPSNDDLLLITNAMMIPLLVDKVFLPGSYVLNEEYVLSLECVAAVRRDIYGVIKLDLTSEKDKIGSGGLGWVSPVITLARGRDGVGVICKNKSDKRVAKVSIKTSTAKDKQMYLSQVRSITDNEADAIKRIKQFNMRGPYYNDVTESTAVICSMMTIERMTGIDLQDVLSKKITLTMDEIFQVILQSLYQLDNQFHDRETLHNDVTPNNIRISRVHNRIKIRFYDCSFSRHEYDKKEVGLQGSPEYLAPEVIEEQRYSKASDIYSLGLCFRLLLEDEGYSEMFSIVDRYQFIQERIRRLWDGVVKFRQRSDISEELYAKLKALVLGMTNTDPDNRSSLFEYADQVEAIYTDFIMSKCPQSDEQDKIDKAMQNASFFAYKSRRRSLKCTQGYERLNIYRTKLMRDIENLADCESQLALFCSRQNEDCLQGIGSYQMLRDKITCVVDEYELACKRYDELESKIIAMNDHAELLQEYDLFKQKIWSIPQQLDEMIAMTKHIYRKQEKLQKKALNPAGLSC